MDFTSVPLYLDHPNWQQHQNFQQEGENPQLEPPLLPPATGPGLAGTIRPGSMADRVRLAKMPQPEPALKCPRCDSSNTKFCYYNNYSQTQPRHFCKTCRRYWTKGGALRNVPVGGGCRRNKKSKGNSSKSQATHSGQTSSSTSSFPSGSRSSEALGHSQSAPTPQFPFMPGLNHHTDYGDADIRFNFGGIHPTSGYGAARSGADMDFHQMGVSSSGGGGNVIAGAGGAEGWRIPQLQQFPFFSSLDPSQGLYTFEGQGVEPGGGASGHVIRVKPSGSSGASQMASVKMEENQGLNLSGQFMAIQGNSQYWSGNAWTDLSGFTSSSATHML